MLPSEHPDCGSFTSDRNFKSSRLALMIGTLMKSAWQVIIVGIRLANVVPFLLCFNPPSFSLFSGNNLTPVTFCVSLLQLMASLCSSQALLFFRMKGEQPCVLLPGIRCCLLIKMSAWRRICRKKGFFFLSSCLVSEAGWLSLIPERYLIILLVRPQWGQRSARGGGTVTQLWQPSGTSDG